MLSGLRHAPGSVRLSCASSLGVYECNVRRQTLKLALWGLEDDMSDLQDDFRATAESIAQDAQIIERLEDEKTSLDANDPRASELSNQVEALAAQLHDKSLAERDIVIAAMEEAGEPA